MGPKEGSNLENEEREEALRFMRELGELIDPPTNPPEAELREALEELARRATAPGAGARFCEGMARFIGSAGAVEPDEDKTKIDRLLEERHLHRNGGV